MNKRQVLVAGTFGVTLPCRAGATATTATTAATAAGASVRKGAGLLTVTGAITRSNRGPLDPALDVTIRATREFDAKAHSLSGPLLGAVVESAGVAPGVPVMLALRTLDGYTVALSPADARRYRISLRRRSTACR